MTHHTTKKHLALDYMNGVASLFVILIHVLSLAVSNGNPSALKMAPIYIAWRLAAFVVPMFLYTGAIKLQRQWDSGRSLNYYFTYILRRFQKIFLPYVLWVIIYYLAFLRISYVRGEWGEFFKYLFTGTLSSPFYYIIIVMQFYLLAPLWGFIARRVPAYAGISVSLLITIIAKQLPAVLSHFNIDFPYTDRIVPSYLVFWVIGLYVGKHYDEISAILRKKSGIIVTGVSVMIFTAVLYIQYSSRVYLLSTEDMKIVSDILTIVFLHGVMLRAEVACEKIKTLLSFLAESSFFVYLSHCLVLTLVTNELQSRGIGDLFTLTLVRFVACYTLPYLAYLIWRCIKKFIPNLRK